MQGGDLPRFNYRRFRRMKPGRRGAAAEASAAADAMSAAARARVIFAGASC